MCAGCGGILFPQLASQSFFAAGESLKVFVCLLNGPLFGLVGALLHAVGELCRQVNELVCSVLFVFGFRIDLLYEVRCIPSNGKGQIHKCVEYSSYIVKLTMGLQLHWDMMS